MQMNNIMKKIIGSLIFLFAIIAIQAQSATVLPQTYTALTLNGVTTDTIIYNPIQGEYDVSLQLIPALSGSGDSLHFTHVLYQSNHNVDAVWTVLVGSTTVSTVTDSDALIAITDFKGLRLRAICTGISTDTVTVTPYSVYKKHAQE